MPPGDPSDDDDFSGFVSNEFDVVPGASADQPGDQPGDPGDVSDDSVFSGEYGNEFDVVVREAADDELPTHFGTEFDAPFIAAAATASDQEKPDEGNEANSKFERLPQNRFRKVFTKFAPTVGDNLRQITKGGKLMRRKGRSNPNTRTCVNILRLKMLKHPPRQEQQQGKCNHNNAVSLCRKTAEKLTQKGVRNIWSKLRATRKTPAGTKHAMLSKTADETEFPVRFSAAENKEWIGWQMVRVNKERWLLQEDIDLIKEVMECNRVGSAHILSQHVRLRFGPGNKEPDAYDVVVPAVCCQRTSTSCLWVAAETVPFEEVSFRYFKERVLPFLEFGLVHLCSDEGPGQERWARETCEYFEDAANCAVFGSFCRGHMVGGSAGESLEAEGILTFIGRQSRILRSHDVHKVWQASQAVQSVARVGQHIIKCSEGEHSDEISASDSMWDLIGRNTIFRESATSAKSHPLDPKGAASEDEQAQTDFVIKELQECFDILKRLFQINSEDFRLGCHLCFVSRCGRFCTRQTWEVEFNGAWSKLQSRICPNRGLQIAKSRFLSWMCMFAMGSLGALCVNIGPEAWLDKWSVTETEQEMQNNARAVETDDSDTNKERHERPVRVHGVSKGWASHGTQAMLTTGNVVIKDLDAFYRYCDRADARSNRGKYPPLLLQLLQPHADRNPLKVYYEKVADMFRPDSDLNYLLRRWNSALKTPVFTWTIGFKSLRMTLRIVGRIHLKVGLELESQLRYQIWRVISAQHFDGMTSLPALQAAQKVEDISYCVDCVDSAFSKPVLGNPPKRGMELHLSKPMAALHDFSSDLHAINLDEERTLSRIREI